MSGDKLPKTIKEKNFEERVKEKGSFLVIEADEPCYTCGHKKLLVYPEKTDGRTVIVKKCLFCITRVHTAANRGEQRAIHS